MDSSQLIEKAAKEVRTCLENVYKILVQAAKAPPSEKLDYKTISDAIDNGQIEESNIMIRDALIQSISEDLTFYEHKKNHFYFFERGLQLLTAYKHYVQGLECIETERDEQKRDLNFN